MYLAARTALSTQWLAMPIVSMDGAGHRLAAGQAGHDAVGLAPDAHRPGPAV